MPLSPGDRLGSYETVSGIGSGGMGEVYAANNQLWATRVDRDGVVCAVAFSSVNRAGQWPGRRVISPQKASTANAFSLDSSSNSAGSGQANGLALSTVNLSAAVQPGGVVFRREEDDDE